MDNISSEFIEVWDRCDECGRTYEGLVCPSCYVSKPISREDLELAMDEIVWKLTYRIELEEIGDVE